MGYWIQTVAVVVVAFHPAAPFFFDDGKTFPAFGNVIDYSSTLVISWLRQTSAIFQSNLETIDGIQNANNNKLNPGGSDERESGKEGEGVSEQWHFNMLAACNVEISFMRFGRGVPESKARWGPVSTQVWKHKCCKPKHKLPIGRWGETILTLTVMDDAASCRGLIDRGPFRAKKHHVLD